MADLQPASSGGSVSSSPAPLDEIESSSTVAPTVPGQTGVILNDIFWAVSKTSSSLVALSSSTDLPPSVSTFTTTIVNAASSSPPANVLLESSSTVKEDLFTTHVTASPPVAARPVVQESPAVSPVVFSSPLISWSSSQSTKVQSGSNTADITLTRESPLTSSTSSTKTAGNAAQFSRSASRATVIVTETISSSTISSSPAAPLPSMSSSTTMSKFFKPSLNHTSSSTRDDLGLSNTAIVANGIQNVSNETATMSPATETTTTMTTFVTNGTTLSGSAALAALAAMTSASSSARNAGAAGATDGIETKGGGSKLSSFAIVGIVAGGLVFSIILYVVWYQWRKKRVKAAINGDHEDEKGVRRSNRNGNDFDDDYDRRTQRSSFGNDPFLDKPTGYSEPTWYRDDDRHSAYEGGHDDGYDERYRRSRYEGDEPGEALDYLEEDYCKRTHTEGIEYDGGLTAAYISHEHGDEAYEVVESPRRLSVPAREAQDPFKPPPPLPRSVSSYSDQFDLASRPLTKASRADSYAYGSIYDGYDRSNNPSRRGTTHELDPTTPATSTLLPWLSKSSDAPPMPSVPPAAKGPSRLRHQYEIAEDVRRPVPPAAVMAQTPAVQGGWSGVIPPFR